MPLTGERYVGKLYRALNPVYAREPLSGRGARLHGGRFNAIGTPALYTALDPAAALRQANQVGHLQPAILVSYVADLGPVFDGRDIKAVRQRNMSQSLLADPGWRIRMLQRQDVPTQDFAGNLMADGFAGLLIRSFARGASEADLNLVLWQWSNSDCALTVVNDEGRLSRM